MELRAPKARRSLEGRRARRAKGNSERQGVKGFFENGARACGSRLGSKARMAAASSSRQDVVFVYEIGLMSLSSTVRAAFVAEMLLAFGQMVPGERLPPCHLWPLRWWSSRVVSFMGIGDVGLAGRALVLSPGSTRVPRDVIYMDKLWSPHPNRGAGKTMMNAMVMTADARGEFLRWRTRDPGFYKRWAETRRIPPPVSLRMLHDRDYVHIGARAFRSWEAEDVAWLRMASAWEG